MRENFICPSFQGETTERKAMNSKYSPVAMVSYLILQL